MKSILDKELADDESKPKEGTPPPGNKAAKDNEVVNELLESIRKRLSVDAERASPAKNATNRYMPGDEEMKESDYHVTHSYRSDASPSLV